MATLSLTDLTTTSLTPTRTSYIHGNPVSVSKNEWAGSHNTLTVVLVGGVVQ